MRQRATISGLSVRTSSRPSYGSPGGATSGSPRGITVRFADAGGVGDLGFTVQRGTHIENEALVTEISGALTALDSRSRAGTLKGTPAGKALADRVRALRAVLGLIRQRVDTENYDFTGEHSVEQINDRLARLKDEARSLVGDVGRAAKARGAERTAVVEETAKTIVARGAAQEKSEAERKEGFFDKYGTYIKWGGAVVGLGLSAYLFGPLIRGVGARVGRAPATAGLGQGPVWAAAQARHGTTDGVSSGTLKGVGVAVVVMGLLAAAASRKGR